MRLVAIPACFLLAGCVWFEGEDRLFVTSEPPGATVLVDGLDVGHTTPATLDIGGFGSHHKTVTVRKEGYRPEVRFVTHAQEGYTPRWVDGAADIIPPAWPLAWTFGDFFAPFGVRWAFVPGTLHVKLHANDAPLLGWDALRAKQQAAAAAATQPTGTVPQQP
ncbi:MAG: hypothetical protein RL148_2471 [Planctomycetota bacterium]|jgi:hypothetical protein